MHKGNKYFNSIKVRLKLSLRRVKAAVCKFQFHKGTIKTSDLFVNSGQDVVFQFHKGTIKTRHLLIELMALLNFNSIKVRLKLIEDALKPCLSSDFNSIKVRLKHGNETGRTVRNKEFQFHKGTIKTR